MASAMLPVAVSEGVDCLLTDACREAVGAPVALAMKKLPEDDAVAPERWLCVGAGAEGDAVALTVASAGVRVALGAKEGVGWLLALALLLAVGSPVAAAVELAVPVRCGDCEDVGVPPALERVGAAVALPPHAPLLLTLALPLPAGVALAEAEALRDAKECVAEDEMLGREVAVVASVGAEEIVCCCALGVAGKVAAGEEEALWLPRREGVVAALALALPVPPPLLPLLLREVRGVELGVAVALPAPPPPPPPLLGVEDWEGEALTEGQEV